MTAKTTAQNRTAHRTTQQKTGFLVRKEMVRSEVRSESMKMDRGDDNFRQSLDETAPQSFFYGRKIEFLV